ncbi:MAG: glycoside hydrolase family 97 protein [Bacteroidales bacterium]|nr:glycoside hydrolase family 97 protein [Bacteroidales bacterium]MDY2916895.1 glycoside hydrolase family 97 protein [Muribaculaceae bacterium]
MNKFFKCFLVWLTAAAASFGAAAGPAAVSSPDGRIAVTVSTDKAGRLSYSVSRDSHVVLAPSRLGLVLRGVPDMADGFRITKTDRRHIDETWRPVWGEESEIRNNCNELRVSLAQPKTAPGRAISVVFRVFNDGVGFRYEFPRQKTLQDFVIMDELTEFAFTAPHRSWSLPVEGIRFYEGLFRELPLDSIGWASTPVTIRDDQARLSMALHEANLTDYAAMNVRATPGSPVLRAALTPWASGEKVFVTDTRVTPWRTLIITDNDGDMMLSRIMLNLNEPCRIDDTSWVRPARYMGVWWCYHMKTATWEDGPRHGATTDNVIRHMDFAARHGFDGVLVEGWNHDWRTWDFSFTRPYDDFDIDSITAFGRAHNVALIGHNETGGKTLNYEAQLDSAMDFYHDKGVHYVKTGYVGDFLDNRERHSSQYGVRHYRKVIERAARSQICIDNHEPVIPTGLQRTYPNLMTQEGVRGQEWDAWCPEGGNPPSHTVTLPFTRLLAGPVDFTPGTFCFENPVFPKTRVLTTLAKQLALFVILYSPLQMASDQIENYEANPGPLAFLSECPTDWERTLYPEAEIGRYITVARHAKDSDTWYLASATGEEARTSTVPLTFLTPGVTYLATIYRDGPDADYLTNPTPVTIEQRRLTAADTLTLPLARSGGYAVRLTRI